MAKPLTSWLVPSFSQHNLCLGVSEHCLHVLVTKFWHKFASLRHVNIPSSWDKFQNCCTDMYLVRFLPNFAGFCGFTWISLLCDGTKYQKPCLYSPILHLGCFPLVWSGPGSVIWGQSDHCPSKEPTNPPWKRIHWFFWSWSRSFQNNLIKLNESFLAFKVPL